MSKLKTETAFTIVELLIVIVVVAILAAITTVAFSGIQDRARESGLNSDLTQATKQLMADNIVSGTFPGTISGANNGKGLAASAGTTYQYTVSTTGGIQSFCLSGINGDKAFHVTQSGTPQAGVCSGHTGPGSTVVACDGYSVGNAGPAGGVIFYKDTSSTPSKCYEAAPAGWYAATAPNDPSAEWGCYNVAVPGADGSAIGTGKQNTADMVTANCSLYNSNYLLATTIVTNYAGGGKTDWYIPSRSELGEMYLRRVAIGGFSNTSYWSSTEFSNASAWQYHLSFNAEGNILKMNIYKIRPIRSFSNN